MTVVTFEALSLSPATQKSLTEMGFLEASPIQAEAIPHLLAGEDIIGQAQTGTGKTAAFAIPIVERINPGFKGVQAVVLCPTRELAVQVTAQFQKLLKHNRQVTVCAIYGGEPIHRQLMALKRKPQILVATPGRMLDHLGRKSIRLNTVKTVVLDEADEMLNMGFREDIESILSGIPQPRQTVFFSATMPRSILELTANYQTNPHHIKVAPPPMDDSLIEQFFIEVQQRRKMETLISLIEFHQLKLGLVFCNTKRQVDELVQVLQREGYAADGLHGGMAQPKRDKVMSRFRKGTISFLVATDVAARGIDVNNIEAVFNYDMPDDQEYYIHRIGRTGRAGNPGKAITFVERNQVHRLRRMKRPNLSLLRHELPAKKQLDIKPSA